jgi:hypothetical protein
MRWFSEVPARRDGMGFYWDTRSILDQEKYQLVDENDADSELLKDIQVINKVLAKYPAAPQNGPMYERYMKQKEGKRKLWDRMKTRILGQHVKEK